MRSQSFLCLSPIIFTFGRNERSSRPEVFCKNGVFGNCAKFTGKHLCQSLFFNKVAGLKPRTLLKNRLWYRCFPVNFAKFLGSVTGLLVSFLGMLTTLFSFCKSVAVQVTDDILTAGTDTLMFCADLHF